MAAIIRQNTNKLTTVRNARRKIKADRKKMGKGEKEGKRARRRKKDRKDE